MKYNCLVLLTLLTLGCGSSQDLSPVTLLSTPPPCTVSKISSVTTITCPGSPPVEVLDGSPGAVGLTGSTGPSGASGVNCTETQFKATNIANDPMEYGGALITCANGSTLITNGVPGQVGATGSQGTPGVNASSVTAVQFCPNVTTTYPSSFPEFGLCLQGSIYGVYWNGTDTWLAEIVPGDYTSTSSTSPCNFTVTTNCGISN